MVQALQVIPFPEWRPDEADLLSTYATEAKNVSPGPVGYKPLAGVGTTVRMSALTARCQGSNFFASINDGFVYQFAGDASKLYFNDSSGTATDASKAGGYSVAVEDTWEFTTFAGAAIASNVNDPIQTVAMSGMSSSTTLTFADLATSTLQPKAKNIATIKRQVVIGNTLEGSTSYPNRVRWCAVDDAADWDASQSTLADFQDIEGVGEVRKVIGGLDYGVILCDDNIVRMDFVGTPDIYTFDKLEPGRGCLSSGSVATWGNLVILLDREGFFAFDGYQSHPIGAEKVDKYFFDNWDANLAFRMTAVIDKIQKIYVIAYASSSATTTDPDSLLIYHIPTKKWSRASVAVEILTEARTGPLTLEQLDDHPLGGDDLDALTVSFDSSVWDGGAHRFGAFNTSHAGVFFDGANLAATIETPVLQFIPGSRAILDSVRPLADGGTLSCSVDARERLNDSESFGSASTQNTDGICAFDSANSGRYHKIRTAVAASGTWTHLEGIVPFVHDAGMF